MSDHLHNFIRALAILVTVQAVFIIDKISFPDNQSNPEIQARQQAIAYSRQPQNEVLLQETKLDNLSFATLSSVTKKIDNQIKVDIYIQSQQGFNTANLVLNFNPQDLQIIDQDQKTPGVQLGLGDADIYLQNQVDSKTGQIQLLTKFNPQFVGKAKLATIFIHKLTQAPTEIKFEFDATSYQTSFVKTSEFKQNILIQPESIFIP